MFGKLIQKKIIMKQNQIKKEKNSFFIKKRES